jgi:hypothetical protein
MKIIGAEANPQNQDKQRQHTQNGLPDRSSHNLLIWHLEKGQLAAQAVNPGTKEYPSNHVVPQYKATDH